MDDSTDARIEPGTFDVLADETRIGVLRALAERQREVPEDPTLGFSELRARVGVADSGNFSYHLDKLVGRFVTRIDGEYRLTNTGMTIVIALLAGTYAGRDQVGPTEIDETCPVCDEPMRATHDDNALLIECSSGHDYRNVFPAGAVENRSLPAAADMLSFYTQQEVEFTVAFGCPKCYGTVEWSPVETEAMTHVLAARCTRCGMGLTVPVGALVVRHPAVVSLYYEHGIDVRERPIWTLDFCTDDGVTVLSEDPLRYRIDVEPGEDRLRVILDDCGEVRSVERVAGE